MASPGKRFAFPSATPSRRAARRRPEFANELRFNHGHRRLGQALGRFAALAMTESEAPYPFFGSTWPPKPLRIAEMIFSA